PGPTPASGPCPRSRRSRRAGSRTTVARPQRRAGVLKHPRMRTLLASSPLGVRRCAKGGAVELGGSYLTAKHRLQTNSRSIRHMSERVRTRFAPSPTGFLHVGTARTALYSYLFA